jgi:urea transport system ATP-binding protein
MRSIVGHHRLTSGSVAFEGKALDRSAAYDRARSGIAFVPQGGEICALLTVRENLESGFAPFKRADRNITGHVFELFPLLKQMPGRRGGDGAKRRGADPRIHAITSAEECRGAE